MVIDNINESTGNGIVISDSEPKNKKLQWIDTSTGGILKYFNGTEWVPVASVWT